MEARCPRCKDERDKTSLDLYGICSWCCTRITLHEELNQMKPQLKTRRFRRLTPAQKFLLVAAGFAVGFILGTVSTKVFAGQSIREVAEPAVAAALMLGGVCIAFLLGLIFFFAGLAGKHDD